MDAIWEISLQAFEIFTLIVGIFGVLVSLLLLFAPKVIKTLSDRFNYYVDVDKKITRFADMDIRTENFIYNHNIISGVCLIVGSVFILIFLFYKLDVQSVVMVIFGSKKFASTNEWLVSSMAILGKISGIAGIFLGSILLFSPDQLKSIESRMNTWFATEPMVARLDRSHRDIDTLVYRRPVVFGLIGLVTSLLLTYLAVNNLLS